MQPKPPRPTGVTILGVLAILGGIAGLVGGAALIGLGLLLGTFAATANVDITNALNNAGYPGLASLGLATISAIVIALGVVALLVGILYLVTGVGFLGGRGWAWVLGMVVTVIGVVQAIVQVALGNYGGVISVIIALLILYYLTRPHVKTFFGRGAPIVTTPPSMGSGSVSSIGTGTMGTASLMNCRSCGARIPAGATKCPSCGASVM